MSDREILAWRTAGIVFRLLHEYLSRSSDDLQLPSSLDKIKSFGDKLYWSAYTLDRRWSFGTGLPFAVQDSEINHHPEFPDDSISSAYLRQMITYCGISSEVRKSLLESSSILASSLPSIRDFLCFRVIQWQNNLPRKLQFGGADDRFDPSKEKRGEYRLRLMLYLRANQMKTVIYRKLFSGPSPGTSDLSAANVMAQVAQDTIHVLDTLDRETNIYRAQQRPFNHFLETALTSLLLVICHAGSYGYIQDIHTAMELINRLAVSSSITRALKERLQGIEEIVTNLAGESTTGVRDSHRFRPLNVRQPTTENFNTNSLRSQFHQPASTPDTPSAEQSHSLIQCHPPIVSNPELLTAHPFPQSFDSTITNFNGGDLGVGINGSVPPNDMFNNSLYPELTEILKDYEYLYF